MPPSDHIFVTSKQSCRTLTISRRWGHRVSIFRYKIDILPYLSSEYRGLSQPSKRCGRRHLHTIAFSKRRSRVGIRRCLPLNGIQVNLNVTKSFVKLFPEPALRVSKRKSKVVERKRPRMPDLPPETSGGNSTKLKTVSLIRFRLIRLALRPFVVLLCHQTNNTPP
jgi:hypothetical protein